MFCAQLSQELSRPVKTGVFGADMQIALMNDLVTIQIDSKNRESIGHFFLLSCGNSRPMKEKYLYCLV